MIIIIAIIYRIGVEIKLNNVLKHLVQCLVQYHSVSAFFYYTETFFFLLLLYSSLFLYLKKIKFKEISQFAHSYTS